MKPTKEQARHGVELLVVTLDTKIRHPQQPLWLGVEFQDDVPTKHAQFCISRMLMAWR
jgi:hypothetical protein